MRHIRNCFSIALFTFLLGLAITSVFFHFTQMPDFNLISDDLNLYTEEIFLVSVGEVHIQYYYTLTNRESTSGVFVVTNKTSNSVYYAGYDKNSHVDNWINQNGKVKPATDLPCYNGVKILELKPDETAIFEIPVPQNRNPFEAGFVFTNHNNEDKKTLWVKVAEPNIFTQK